MTNSSRARLVVLTVLVISLVATLLGRLWYVQVLAGPSLKAEALANQTRSVVTQAPRGEIVDDEGRPLVQNETALVVSVDRVALNAQADDGAAVLGRLAALLHIPEKTIVARATLCVYDNPKFHDKDCWPGLAYQPIPVSESKPTATATLQALQIKELPAQYPGVSVAAQAVRVYPKPDGALASSVLGYTSEISAADLAKLSPAQQKIAQDSQVGVSGLEAEYQSYLGGTPGVKQVEVNSQGAVSGTVSSTAPVTGDSIVTNIDAKVQADLEKNLQAAVTAAKAAGQTADYAAGVVMNVQTGGVIAMGDVPTYQPNKSPNTLSTQQYDAIAKRPGLTFYGKAYQSEIAPGSTFKLISSLGLIQDGTASVDGSYDCPSTFQNRHNFEGEDGLGYISFQTAIEVSCDTFFFKLGYQDWERDEALVQAHKKPREGVQAMARRFGLGTGPDVDLPGAASGTVGDRANTKTTWEEEKANYCAGAKRRPQGSYLQKIDAYDCQYGYEFGYGLQESEDLGQGSVTMSPLQLAVAYSALANGGTIYEPRVAKAIVSPTGQVIKRIKAPVRGHIPVSQATLDYLRNAFYSVTQATKGTASSVYQGFPFNKVDVGGKTGTAQLTGTNEDGSWFASFAGRAGGKPQYVTVIYVDKADQGAESAAPYTRKIWDAIYGLEKTPAIFPNGVAPTALPALDKLNPTAASATPTPSHKSTRHSTSTPTATPGTSTTALGAVSLPPALEPRESRWRGLS